MQIIDEVLVEMRPESAAVPAADARTRPVSKADEAARDIQRASSELWALYEVAQTLSSSLGLAETLDILARKLEAILPGTACLFLMHDDGRAWPCAPPSASTTSSSAGAHPRTRQRLAAGRRRARPPMSARTTPTTCCMTASPVAAWTPLQSALIVPIVHQGEVLGTINLYHPQPDAFRLHDRQLLETIAERSAMALYNGLLFDRTRSHAFTDPLTGLYNLRYLTE